MELQADPSPASGTELERLEKDQSLGEAADLGCRRFETANAIKASAESGPTEIQGKTAIRRGPITALTAATSGGSPAAIETCTGKTRKSAGEIG